MNINLTLLGQMISFAIFVWFCMKYVWPPIIEALEKRKQEIADGLANAEKGNEFLDKAKQQADEQINQAKIKARELLVDADKTGQKKIEQSKKQAKVEAQKVVTLANEEIENEVNKVKEQLRYKVAVLAIEGAEKILQKEVDAKTHQKMLNDLSLKL